MSKPVEKTRILFVQQEMKTWQSAKMWGYGWHVGLEEGFVANGVEVTTLLSSWFPKAKELCAKKTFDQVWINDVTHMFEPNGWDEYRLTEADLEWLAGLAPVRLGFVIESLQYTSQEYAEAPFLYNALKTLKRTAGYLTHIMVPDEKDFDLIREFCNTPLSLLLSAVPQRFVSRDITTPPLRKLVFRGTPYGERARWLEIPCIKKMLQHQLTSDNYTNFPEIFDRLHRNLYPQAISSEKSLNELYASYLDLIRGIRRCSFRMYLDDMNQGSAVVNLPSYGKVYTGKVYEGMAAGRPVITMKIEGSPRMAALFEDGIDILLYPQYEPEVLAEHIQRILDEPDFGHWIAVNARNKILRFHTMEKRVQQILSWIENGREPDFISNDSINKIAETSIAVCAASLELPDNTAVLLNNFEISFQRQLTSLSRMKYLLYRTGLRLCEVLKVIMEHAIKIKRLTRSYLLKKDNT